MSSLLLRTAIALVLVFAIACRSPTDAGGLRIVPEHETFVLSTSHSVVVHYSATNASSSAVMLWNTCGLDLNPGVERASTGDWTEYSGGPVPGTLRTCCRSPVEKRGSTVSPFLSRGRTVS